MNYSGRFTEALRCVYNHGDIVSPRGMETKEVSPYTISVDPLKTLFIHPVREVNYSFCFAENLWYWSGRNSLSLLNQYNSNYKNFANDGMLQGSYGPQILEQIRYVYETLLNDKDSRQAVISLWRPNPRQAKDIPCTLIFHFMIRDGKLNMYITMRSNDVIWGQNYDIPSFSLILLAVAGMLRIKPGTLHLTANSLHLYERHYDLAQKILNKEDQFTNGELIENDEISSLEEHMMWIEEILRAHYLSSTLKDGFNLNDFNHVPKFYRQFIGMMHFYNVRKSNDCLTKLRLRNFMDEVNPFLSKIVHDKLTKTIQS